MGGAVGGAVGAVDGASRVGGGAGVVAGSSGWTRPGSAVVVGAGGRHGAETGAQACMSTFRFHFTKLGLEAFMHVTASMSLIPGHVIWSSTACSALMVPASARVAPSA